MKIREIEELLKGYGAENPREETFILLEEYFGVSRARLMTMTEEDFSSSLLDEALRQRKKHIPIQHILGKWEFMGKKFYVSSDCLIPRPDTEILVEKAIEIVKKGGDVADFCTGSGCIGISIALYTEAKSVLLMDISEKALDMARKNAELHKVQDKCTLLLGDICKDTPKSKFDVIVSNPPYIPTEDVDFLSPEVKKEPRIALDGGEDGLDIIRFLIGDGLSYLKENGTMLIEFGYDQGEIMDTLLREKRDTGSIKAYEILYDYGNNPRVAVIYAN